VEQTEVTEAGSISREEIQQLIQKLMNRASKGGNKEVLATISQGISSLIRRLAPSLQVLGSKLSKDELKQADWIVGVYGGALRNFLKKKTNYKVEFFLDFFQRCPSLSWRFTDPLMHILKFHATNTESTSLDEEEEEGEKDEEKKESQRKQSKKKKQKALTKNKEPQLLRNEYRCTNAFALLALIFKQHKAVDSTEIKQILDDLTSNFANTLININTAVDAIFKSQVETTTATTSTTSTTKNKKDKKIKKSPVQKCTRLYRSLFDTVSTLVNLIQKITLNKESKKEEQNEIENNDQNKKKNKKKEKKLNLKKWIQYKKSGSIT